MKSHEMSARMRDQGREPGHEIHGLEAGGMSFVGPGAAELVEDAPIGQFVQSVESQGGQAMYRRGAPRRVAVVAGGNAHVSVQAVAIQAGASGSRPRKEPRRVGAHTADEVGLDSAPA